ncbi:hypothetical protein FRC06_003020 [Ceratobasidium sp. 370]|nr:hypothetical protein FRC06_003020 [Ceratobasidium sp. 370]
MEIEGGSALAILQSTGGVVLGGRHQPPATGTANDDPPPGPHAQPTSGATVEPSNEDTATEAESEPEIIELRPEDSVSQHIPPTCTSLHTPPYPPVHSQPRRHPPTSTKLNGSESNIEIPCLSTHSSLCATAPSAASILPPDISNPTPLSDTSGILTKAVQLVEQAGVGCRDTNLNQLTQLLSSLQLCLGATASGSQPRVLHLRPTDLLEDNAEVLETEAALELGKHIGAYETFGVFCGWVKEAYESVWAHMVPHVPLLKAPQLLKSIDMQTGTDPYENPVLLMCIAVGFFSGPEPLGMVYKKMFSPLLLPVIAMVLTTMQHCLNGWRTGWFIAIELKADRHLKMYSLHLQGLLMYARRAPKQLRDFQAD